MGKKNIGVWTINYGQNMDRGETYENLEVWNFLKIKLTSCGFGFLRQKK